MGIGDMTRKKEALMHLLKNKQSKSHVKRIDPSKEAFLITVFYLIFGLLWIFLSDTILNIVVKDQNTIQTIQLFKGWLFVFLTGAIIYSMTFYRMKHLKRTWEMLKKSRRNISSLSQELELKEDKIYELAYYDPMTNLLNWQGLATAFEELMLDKDDDQFAIYYVDIDNIKHINETLGHNNGNLLLKEIADRIRVVCQENCVVSRVSGDEFVLIKPYDQENQVHDFGKAVVKACQLEWGEEGFEFMVTASVGVALYPHHGQAFDNLMRHADLAMFIAKDQGRNQYAIYKDAIGIQTKAYVEMIGHIRRGIEKDEFLLYYQPIVDIQSEEIIGVEALIRWEHPQKGFLTPYHFIDIAEQSGQISNLGHWVFDQACRQLRVWKDLGIPLKMSINLSGKRLFDKGLVASLKKIRDVNGLEAGDIQLEVTETSVMENLEEAIKILKAIRDLGILIALDDFGTGYSSLTYLQKFPIDVLKIDKVFISKLYSSQSDKSHNILDTIIDLGHRMNLTIVAEGVESQDQVDYLKRHKCDYGQGYLYDKPMSPHLIEEKYFPNTLK